nr:hypothetical protein [uncultured Albidiferax sp.]
MRYALRPVRLPTASSTAPAVKLAVAEKQMPVALLKSRRSLGQSGTSRNCFVMD